MRMPRLRFTIRRMMVAVAIVAVGLWLHRRSAHFWVTAFDHSRMVQQGMGPLTGMEGWKMTPKGRYHHDMTLKYERAARYPWLPVITDAGFARRGVAGQPSQCRGRPALPDCKSRSDLPNIPIVQPAGPAGSTLEKMPNMPIDIARVRELKRQELERQRSKSPTARATFCRPAGPQPEDTLPAFDCLADAAKSPGCKGERVCDSPSRVAIEPEVRDRYADFAGGVVQWADEPTPKLFGLRVSLDIANGYDGAVMGVVVTLRAVSDRMEYGIWRIFEGERINGNTYPPRPAKPLYPPGHLQESLDAMYSQLTATIRDRVGLPLDCTGPSSAG
jgi:hypothetical protein